MPHWTQEETDYLRKHAKTLPIEQIAYKLGRTRKSVETKCYNDNIVRNSRVDGYTLKEIRSGLHVCYETIMRWDRLGWIVAGRQGPSAWSYNFTDETIAKFLRNHLNELDEETQKSLWVSSFLEDYIPVRVHKRKNRATIKI
jgi:hypothetical protein